MKLRAAFAKSLAKQHQQQALCYFHLNFRTAFLFCRSFVLVICLGWKTDSGTGRWADEFWAFRLAHAKKHIHTQTRKKHHKKKKETGKPAGFFLFLFHFFGVATLVTNVSFFFFFLSFISLISKIWQKLTEKIAKLSPNLH